MEKRQAAVGVKEKKPRSPIVLPALGCVYLFWGGTYLGMKFAIESIPPFLMAGIRFSLAGWFLYIVYRLKGEKRPTFGEWKNAGIVGALMLLGANGVIAWAEQQVPSSIASLLVATVPLWIAAYGYVSGEKKPGAGSVVGILLGLGGIGVLVWNPNGTSSQGTSVFGTLALIFASLSWTAGSMFSRKAKLPAAPLLSTGAQMIAGGALLLIVAAFHGDYRAFDITRVSASSWTALGYLVVFGSLVGYTAYIWLMKNSEPAVVSTYAFVNPVVAVFLGWLLADERIGSNALVSAVMIIASVVLITLFRDKPAAKREAGEDAAGPEKPEAAVLCCGDEDEA